MQMKLSEIQCNKQDLEIPGVLLVEKICDRETLEDAEENGGELIKGMGDSRESIVMEVREERGGRIQRWLVA